jgi:RHS repeat-associated protein
MENVTRLKLVAKITYYLGWSSTVLAAIAHFFLGRHPYEAINLSKWNPFGNTNASGAASTSTFDYTGRENDGGGFYYYRGRYYHAQIGRFVSEDPIGLVGWDVNLYAYVWNSPTNFVDPSGRFGWPIHVKIRKDALQMVGLSPDSAMAQQVAAVDLRPGSQGEVVD